MLLDDQKEKLGLREITYDSDDVPNSWKEHLFNVLKQQHAIGIFEELKIDLFNTDWEDDWKKKDVDPY